jgi:4-hydroxybenzoate polyprenyltransferase
LKGKQFDIGGDWAILNILFYSNFWIALAAYAQVQMMYLVYKQGLQWLRADALAVFFGTWFIYSLLRLVKANDHLFLLSSPRVRALIQHQSSLACLTVITACFAFWFFIKIAMIAQCLLIGLTVLAIGYGIPLHLDQPAFRLLPYLKIFLVALVWASVTVGLPAIQAGQLLSFGTMLWFFERFCFVFAITIPFDLRDMRQDAIQKIQTLPNAFGMIKSIKIAHFALCISTFLLIGLAVLPSLVGLTLQQSLVLVLVNLVTAVFVKKAQRPQHEYFYVGVLDGLLIVQAVIVVLF